MGTEDLGKTVISIFNHYLDRPPDEPIKIERLHRVQMARNTRSGTPRNVICKIHHYPQKDAIIRGGREKGPLEVQGSQVLILQDLASKTLGMGRTLKPLLDIARSKGIPYRWGYPFFLTLKKDGRTFTLRTPGQLPGAFRFLDSLQVEIEDWMLLLVDSVVR